MSEPNVPPPPSYTPPPPPGGTMPPPPGGAVSSNRNLMIVLAYLWILAIVPLVAEKEDREVQWHARHGLVLLVAEILLWIVISIVQFAIIHVFAPLGCLVSILSLILWLGIVVVHILCIVKGINGQRFIIPGISQYADKF
ncbi:MAG TPA: hypothetical protein VFR03_15800 [Thermoanaerobaculia bacterium]|nr:hypothetical protein [Thermoanaerobaculia bacterium]